MSAEKPTPVPWAQGITLATRQTATWTPEERARNDAQERRMVFAQFSAVDQGRSRVLIAICAREEDAELIVRRVNMYDGLLDELRVARAALADFAGLTEPHAHALARRFAETIAKAGSAS